MSEKTSPKVRTLRNKPNSLIWTGDIEELIDFIGDRFTYYDMDTQTVYYLDREENECNMHVGLSPTHEVMLVINDFTGMCINYILPKEYIEVIEDVTNAEEASEDDQAKIEVESYCDVYHRIMELEERCERYLQIIEMAVQK